MDVNQTERGFEIIRFEDLSGIECTLQQSSDAIYEQPGSGALWLGIGDDRMHLSEIHVEAIVEHLSAWLETGSLRAAETGGE